MPYAFSVPSLPPAVYEFVKRVSQRYGLTQRQVVIAALKLLNDVGGDDAARVEALLQRVREQHPSRGSRRSRVET